MQWSARGSGGREGVLALAGTPMFTGRASLGTVSHHATAGPRFRVDPETILGDKSETLFSEVLWESVFSSVDMNAVSLFGDHPAPPRRLGPGGGGLAGSPVAVPRGAAGAKPSHERHRAARFGADDARTDGSARVRSSRRGFSRRLRMCASVRFRGLRYAHPRQSVAALPGRRAEWFRRANESV
jgi:hypothetical protein